MKSGSESVIRTRRRGKQRVKRVLMEDREREKASKVIFFKHCRAHLSIKNSCWRVSRNFLVSMVAK